MNRATWLQDRRMLKFVDVLSRWEAGQLSMLEASELLGMSSGSSGAIGTALSFPRCSTPHPRVPTSVPSQEKIIL